MAKKKDLSKLIGKKCRLTEQGLRSYPHLEGSKILNVVGNNIYIEQQGYGVQGYGIPSTYIKCEILETVQDFQKENDDISKEIAKLQLEIEVNKSRIEFMQENQMEVFDEDTFKAFGILTIIEKSKSSKIQKAAAISKLMNSK